MRISDWSSDVCSSDLRDGLAPVTIEKISWLLAKAYPVIGNIPIAQITPHEALAVLRKVEATGAYESARRMRSVLSRVFRYGVATVRCDKDVAADLRGAIARSEEHTSELQSLMRNSYAVFCLKKKKK